MNLIPEFKIGLWNAWIFMAYYFSFSIIFMFNKSMKKRGALDEIPYTKIEKIIVWYIGYLVWIAILLYSIFLPLKMGTLCFYIGSPLCLLGLIIYTISGINFVTTSIDKPITKGLYRVTRHPIYIAHDFILIGLSVACASWLFLLISAFWIVGQHISAIREEALCIKKYGDEYREYMKKTPRYFLFF